MQLNIEKLWEAIRAKQDALEAEGNYGESHEALVDLIQFLDEHLSFSIDGVLMELIEQAGIKKEEVLE